MHECACVTDKDRPAGISFRHVYRNLKSNALHGHRPTHTHTHTHAYNAYSLCTMVSYFGACMRRPGEKPEPKWSVYDIE